MWVHNRSEYCLVCSFSADGLSRIDSRHELRKVVGSSKKLRALFLHMQTVSLASQAGQHQAVDAILKACHTGGWVMLSDCHLTDHWNVRLRKAIEVSEVIGTKLIVGYFVMDGKKMAISVLSSSSVIYMWKDITIMPSAELLDILCVRRERERERERER